MRPPDLIKQVLGIFGVIELKVNLIRWFSHVRGKINAEEATYLREKDFPKVFLTARVWGLIFFVTLASALFLNSFVPLLLVVTPRLYGTWQMSMTGALHHLGMAENVTNHRLNTRTVMMGAINRFLYLNMNYHVEHHMFTMVPYYQLPALTELIKDDLPAAETSIFAHRNDWMLLAEMGAAD